MKEEKSRIWLLSNMKALLIWLVVFGHFLPHMDGLGAVRYQIRVFIWMFHMPAFLFISGFLSKNLEKCRTNAVRQRLFPYILLVLIIGISRWAFLGKPFAIGLVQPALSAWYFLVLFWYAVFTVDLVKFRWCYPLVCVLALGMGCYGQVGSAYAAGKAFAFLPFYLAGFYCTEEMLLRLKKLPKLLALPALVLAVGIALWLGRQDVDAVVMLSMRDSYAKLGLDDGWGIFLRLAGYLGAALMIFVLVQISCARKTAYSYIGDNTLVIYSFHLVAIYALRYFGGIWNTGHVALQLLQAAVVSLAIAAILGIPKLTKGYSSFINKCYGLLTK